MCTQASPQSTPYNNFIQFSASPYNLSSHVELAMEERLFSYPANDDDAQSLRLSYPIDPLSHCKFPICTIKATPIICATTQ